MVSTSKCRFSITIGMPLGVQWVLIIGYSIAGQDCSFAKVQFAKGNLICAPTT